MEDSEYDKVESEFSPANCWQCNYCGNLIACDFGFMQEHLENCESFQEKK